MIPFVKALGDEIERAAAERLRRRRRLRISAAVLAVVIAVGGAAAAPAIFNDPEQLAAGSVACYEALPKQAHGASVLPPGERSPVEVCATVLRTDSPLVACDAGEHVAVFPGTEEACARAGMAPLPRGFDAARDKVNAFSRRVMALQAAAECIPPEELGRRIQRLLDRSGWRGWRVDVRLDLDSGPCGWATSPGGDGRRSVLLGAEDRVVTVTRGPTRSTDRLLSTVGARLWEEAWDRCYDEAGLRALAAERFPGRSVAFTRWEPPEDVEIEVTGPDGQPKQEGCATFASVTSAEDGVGIVVEVDP
jgi:hypothetical protein